MKVLTVVGARPQFIKAATFCRALRDRHNEVLVHTGQHYDDALSGDFFRELDIPAPDHNLGIGSGPHGEQTAKMLLALEPLLLSEAPDWVAVFGDTNSTLAGALAAAKLGVPLAHVEAGLRSFDRSMPEEINRVLTDHCANLLFCPTATAMDHLEHEGLASRAHLTGDIMLDSLQSHRPRIDEHNAILEKLAVTPGEYCLATVHRAANTDDRAALGRIVEAFGRLDGKVVLPLHPRTKAALSAAGITLPKNVLAIDAIGYLDMLALESNARIVLTDSGGVQKEAYLLETPCVTLREETEWPETSENGWNVLAGTDVERIVEAANRSRPSQPPSPAFGDGRAAQHMVDLLQHDPSIGGRLD